MSIPSAMIAAAKAQADFPITFDAQGRMQYHPAFHENQNKPWKTTDIQYLIQNYDVLGPEHVSLHLKRTVNSVMRYACALRKSGQMPKVASVIPHERIYTRAKLVCHRPGTLASGSGAVAKGVAHV